MICPYCLTIVHRVLVNTDPIGTERTVEPHPIPAGRRIPAGALACRWDSPHRSVRRHLVGRVLDPANPLRPGEAIYADHRPECERLEPDHPRRPGARALF